MLRGLNQTPVSTTSCGQSAGSKKTFIIDESYIKEFDFPVYINYI